MFPPQGVDRFPSPPTSQNPPMFSLLSLSRALFLLAAAFTPTFSVRAKMLTIHSHIQYANCNAQTRAFWARSWLS